LKQFQTEILTKFVSPDCASVLGAFIVDFNSMMQKYNTNGNWFLPLTNTMADLNKLKYENVCGYSKKVDR